MRTQWMEDPRKLAALLHEAYRGLECVVNVRRGADKLGQAVLRVERVYVDDDMPDTRTLRVVGHLPGGDEHGTLALPLDGPAWAVLPDGVGAGPAQRCAVFSGPYQLNFVPIEE